MRQGYRNLLSDTAVFAAGNILTKLMQFALLPLYTAFLTTEQYGVGELINNTAELIYPLCCLGIYEGVLRYSIDEGSDKVAIFSSSVLLSAAFAPVVIALGLLGYIVAGFAYSGFLVALCILSSIRMICLQFAKGIGCTRLYAVSGVLGAFVLCVFGCALLGVCGMGVSGYLISLVAGQAVQILFVAMGAKMWRYFSMPQCSFHALRPLLGYSLPMIPNTIAWWFVNLSARYIVLFVQGPAMAGLYTAASKLPAIVNMFVSVFQQSWQIFSAREYGSSDKGDSYSLVFKVFSIFLLCSGSLVVALSNPISSIMFGPGFYEAHIYVPLLLFGAIINGYSTYFGVLYNAAKRNRMIFVTTVVGALIGVVVGFALCGVIGVWGPAAGTALSYSVISLVRAVDTRKIAAVHIDLTYQVVGLIVISAEVALISLQVCGATAFSLALFAILVSFSLVRYRDLVGFCLDVLTRRVKP